MPSTLRDRLSLLPQITYQHVFRAAGADAGSAMLDFSILSVAVMTLGLILLVELGRHKLDVNATGRPFFKTVLEGVYRELATLGIVEFVIFLLHKYYEDLDVAKELVFADIHFTLFFTALFNAFQSCIMAFFISRNSHKLWVQTEYQDLHHYVEIREEFDRIDKELLNLRDQHEEMMESLHQSTVEARKAASTNVGQSITARLWSDESSGGLFKCCVRGIKQIWLSLVRSVRYPHLTRKHNDLLVQVRFHELKFHFIEANKLPISLHLSEYLKRCELRILQKMVHISTFAWLLLTAALNLLYFLMGVVTYVTDGNMEAVGMSLSVLFFSAMVFFVILSLVVWNKMTSIFHNIMYMKLISQTSDQVSVRTLDEEVHEFHQISLFWGSSPKYITVMIQFMQFGFALALSTLLVFWSSINPTAGSGGVAGGYYVLCVLVCYSCFVYIISHVVPRFTLCTSVGQMVDQRRLHETLARHRLAEAQRERAQALMEQEFENLYMQEGDDLFTEQPTVLKAIQSLGGAIPESKQQPLINPELLAALVRTDATDLRSTLPVEEIEKLSEREERMQERRNRRKTLSEGVGAMRNMVGMGSEVVRDLVGMGSEHGSDTPSTESRKATRHRRLRSNSASASIEMMRGMPSPPKAEPPVVPPKAKDDSEILAAAKATRRANRKKTTSASADIRMMRMSTLREDSMSNSLPGSKLLAAPPVAGRSVKIPSSFAFEPFSNSLRQVVESVPFARADDFDAHPLTRGAASESPGGKPANPSQLESLPATAPPPVLSFGSLNQPSVLKSESEVSIEDVFAARPAPTVIENVAPKMVDYVDETKTDVDSEDDDRSDADDLPEVHESDRIRKTAPPARKRTLLDFARIYFRGRRYVVVSTVFGTMICFFFVAMRLESVMINTHVIIDSENTWHSRPTVCFWMEFSFLACFLLGDFIILYLFRPVQMTDNLDRRAFTAAIFDLCICATCMGLLMGSQAQRCCDEEDQRLLAEYKTVEKFPFEDECCPAFGSRLYGGFGNIEMFTSLVALRVFRFWAAKFVVWKLDSRFGWSEMARAATERADNPAEKHPFDPFYERKGHGHSHGIVSLQDETGTIVELWKTAIGLYPEIVEKHGAFSSHLLQAMLGIAVIENEPTEPVQKTFELGMETLVEQSDESFSGDLAPQMGSPMSANAASLSSASHNSFTSLHGSGTSQKTLTSRPSISADTRYSGLSPDAQSIILAGKVGKPVRARRESKSFDGIHSLGPVCEESTTSLGMESVNEIPRKIASRQDFNMSNMGVSAMQFGESQPELGRRASMARYPEFEVGLEDDDEFASQFFAPNARLIRTMRRCDRKVIPMLDRWTVVDVVITKCEIVYFDASDVDDIDNNTNQSPHVRRMQDVRQAIIATKGGKGLRLRDVAFGRRVVGTQELQDIEAINVERIMPHEHDAIEEAGHEPQAGEFWKDSAHQQHAMETLDESEKPSRHNRWMRVKEDRLKVKTLHDTLYLRFYSDLENCECNKDRVMNESEIEGELFKDNAFQWCQTIGRLVGAYKLKQELPHFGDENDDELRDYLVVVEPSNEQNGRPVVKRFKKMVTAHLRQRSEIPPFIIEGTKATSHRRHRSEMPASSMFGGMIPPKPGHVQRASTVGETTSGLEQGKPSKPLRRSDSADDYTSGLEQHKKPSKKFRRYDSAGD